MYCIGVISPEDSCDRLICINAFIPLKHPEILVVYTSLRRHMTFGVRNISVRIRRKAMLSEYIMRADELAFSEAKNIYNSNCI